MKKNGLKKISALIAVTMIAGVIPVVPVNAQRAAVVSLDDGVESVHIFDTFSGYSKNFADASKASPDKWVVNRKALIGAVADDTTGGNVLKLGVGSADNAVAESIMHRNFGKVVDSGKLHYSYNYKTNNTDFLTYEAALYDARQASYSVDSYDFRELDDVAVSRSICWRNDAPWQPTDNIHNNGKISVFPNSGAAITSDYGASDCYKGEFVENTWNMADVFYDLDNSTYDVYVNGEEVAKDLELVYNGLKGIRSNLAPSQYFDGDGNKISNNKDYAYAGYDTAFSYIDNIYVHEYTGNNDEIEMAVDTTSFEDDNTVTVAFSEYMNQAPTVDDIIVTNLSTGMPVSSRRLAIDNATRFGFKISGGLNKDSAYMIEIAPSSELRGAISNEKVEKSCYILSESDASVKKYMYMDETFSDYEEGTLPVGWSFGSNAKATGRWPEQGAVNDARISTFGNTVDGTDGVFLLKSGADKTSDNQAAANLYYYWPNTTPLTGDFTMEFDVYNTNGGWTFGWMLAEDYDAARTNNAGTVKYDNINPVIAFGTKPNNNTLFYNINRTAANPFTALTGSPIIPSEEWSHIKVDVNMGQGVYTFTINDDEVYTSQIGIMLGQWRKGIAGINLKRWAKDSGDIAFDNIKIYKNTSMIMNDNFNNLATALEAGFVEGQCGKVTSTDQSGNSKTSYYPYLRTDALFKPMGGWYSMETNQIEDVQAVLANSKSEAHVIGVTPAYVANTTAGVGSLRQAAAASKQNSWTKEQYDNGERVMSISGGKWSGTGNSVTTTQRKGMTRIQKYFNRAIEEGTPFEIAFNYVLNDPNQSFGISVLTENDMRVKNGENDLSQELGKKYTDNLLLAWTGAEIVDTGMSGAWIAPNKDMSLNDVWKTNGSLPYASVNEANITDANVLTVSSKGGSSNWEIGSKIKNKLDYASGRFVIPRSDSCLHQCYISVNPYYDENGNVKVDLSYKFHLTNNDYTQGSITLDRDFMTRRFVGLAFDYMGARYSGTATMAATGILVDNLQVYEIDSNGAVKKTAKDGTIEEIKAVKYDGTEINLNSTNNEKTPVLVPMDIERIDIKFSKPLANSATDEGFVELLRADTAWESVMSVPAVKSLSKDKKTLTLRGMNSDGKWYKDRIYKLYVSANIEFDDNVSQLAKNNVSTLQVAQKDSDDFGVTELVVKKPIDIYDDNGEKVGSFDGIQKRVSDLKDIDENSVIYISGYNTTNESKEILLANAEYAGMVMNNCDMMKITEGNYGLFNESISASEMKSNPDIFKVFAWEYSTLKPLIKQIEIK